jgi:twinkle protein
MTDSESVLTGHEPCPECGSRDNLARYSDGHGYCFGCKHHEPSDRSSGGSSYQERPVANMIDMAIPLIAGGSYQDLATRGLRAETLKKFGYRVGDFRGSPCHIAPYCDKDGRVVAQKLRLAGKEFKFAGEPKHIQQLFGQNVWGSGGRKIVVTEGEIDAMTVAQCQDLKWPVVSVVNGAQDDKSIRRAVDWLETFDEVIFMYDADEPGRAGAAIAAALMSPGKAKIASLPDGSDPNQLMMDKKLDVIQRAIWDAKPYRPDAIRSLSDLITEASRPVSYGYSLPFPTLYELSYGPKPGQLWIGGAGVGIGKTDVFTEFMAHSLSEGRKVGAFLLEQNPVESVQRIAAKLAGKPFFKPDCLYGEAELQDLMRPYEEALFIYDHSGSSEWDEIERHIRWLVKAHGVEEIYVDNLTVLAADAHDERRYLDGLLKSMKSLATGLNIVMHTLSHLSTPSGTAHEEGGRVEAKQFTGSRAVMRYADFMWGIERDTQAGDPQVRSTSTIRILKDRLTGQSAGEVFYLRYDAMTSRMSECDTPPKDSPNDTKGSDAAIYGFG